jgi:protease I
MVDAQMAITAVSAKEFAAIIILGGRAPEYLRNDASLLSLVREFSVQNKCICAIGHGIQVRDGRMITAQSWKSHPEFYRELFTSLELPK